MALRHYMNSWQESSPDTCVVAGQTMILAVCLVAFSGARSEAINPDQPDEPLPRIGSITINNGSIFDLENPEENKLLYRLANKIHLTTRPQVIEQQLLFETGEDFSRQSLNESERILRDNRYIQEAQIEPIRRGNGVVDINVNTTDTWTLVPKLSFSHSGGESSTGLGLKEGNLFGHGVGIELLYESDVDRDSKTLKLVDKQLGSSWYGIRAIAEDNSDGHLRSLELGQPFYSLDTRSSRGFSYLDADQTDSLYDRGEIAAQYRHMIQDYDLQIGWSKGLRNGWARRYVAGLGYDEHRFAEALDPIGSTSLMPADRKFIYPYVGIEFVQNKFEEAVNFDQIARTEDRFVGSSFSARIGAAQSAFGSSTDAWILRAGAQTSISKSQSSSLVFASDFGTRIETDGVANLLLNMDAKYYKRLSDKRMFFVRLNGSYGQNLDLDQQMYLGGDNGLRGYPLRYQSGDKRALLTLEQRFYTDWYPFRLFRVGAAVFYDMGRTWGEGPLGTGNDGLLRDVGAGLRLGNTRSSLGNVVHIDVAYPLDGNNDISNVQFIVEIKKSF